MSVERKLRPRPTRLRIAKRRARLLIKSLLSPEPPAEAPLPGKVRHHWSIGIYQGSSPFELAPPPRLRNPVLTAEDVTDVYASFIADPFMLPVDGSWYMFFEVMNSQTKRGEIALATSKNGLKWRYQQVVLFEPFHLSYPYTFEWEGNFYMVPESNKDNSIRLYQAVDFPARWSLVGKLMEGQFTDSSFFRYSNKWWLFTETNPDYQNNTLRLYYADDLVGPWQEHPASPIISGDPHQARPAGRVVVLDNRIIRYAQDCAPFYGTRVHAFEIADLSPVSYHEQSFTGGPILAGSGRGWNAHGMHHVDAHQLSDGQWLAAVDGWYNRSGRR